MSNFERGDNSDNCSKRGQSQITRNSLGKLAMKTGESSHAEVGESPTSSSTRTMSWRTRNDGNAQYNRVLPTNFQSTFRGGMHQNYPRTSYMVRKMSKSELMELYFMNPLESFLEVMVKIERFEEAALGDSKSQEIVILLIIILGKVYTVPLEYFLIDLSRTLFGKEEQILENDILSYMAYAIDLEEARKPNTLPLAGEVWKSLEAFCRYGLTRTPGLNVWSFMTRQLCSFLENKTNENLVRKYSLFSKLNHDMENNIFYPLSIHPSVEDINTEPILDIPNCQNGRYEKDIEFLIYQFERMKFDVAWYIYEGLKDFRALPNAENDPDRKTSVLFELDTCLIFPCVRIYKEYPGIMKFNDKYFLLDLAPHKRVNHVLPPEIKEILTEHKDRAVRGHGGFMGYVSSSSKFDDLIITYPIYLSKDFFLDGFVFIDIVKMERVKQSILNRDLFLLSPEMTNEPTYRTLQHMKKVSTLTLPMKEYFVDFETAAMVPDYENLKEYSFSLEEINIRAGEYKEAELAPLGMNSIQFEAFQLVLTRRLTLIHGPPGTGKSSVAFKIIQRLLSTTSFRILVVCYRNIVLDRFLLRCTEFTDKIVRLGHFHSLSEIEEYKIDLKHQPSGSTYKNLTSRYWRKYGDSMTAFVKNMDSFNDPRKVQNSFMQLRQMIQIQDQLKHLKLYDACKEARIIGMTTTGAAKYHDLVKLLEAPIVIMEEASEVPEPQVINCLTNKTQQLIMIGDHKQDEYLFELNLDKEDPKTSLFERMAEHGKNTIYLNVQCRMHPDIADLVRGTIYEDLSDGDNVKNYPPIRGIGRNLYFVNHENLETVAKDRYEFLRAECPDYDMTSTSKENFYEMLFTVGLANYLRQQGYQSSEIIILSAYSSQAEGICEILTKFPTVKDIEVHTVDSYQGQESKIVILSLVRNNIESSIGFLISTQRLCVLLTRAQQGLFILGNMNIMAASSKEWTEIKEKLEDKDAIGPGLPIQCEKHNCEMVMTGMEDFLKFSRDGCPIGETQGKGQGHPCLQETL